MARSLCAQGHGYDIDEDATARESMMTVCSAALVAAFATGKVAPVFDREARLVAAALAITDPTREPWSAAAMAQLAEDALTGE